MTTISYDQPVLDLIAGLDATKHVGFINNHGEVMHQNFTKTMVTVHHNGGGPDFTPQDILNIWKSRPASAHFDVDGHGSVAQYADVHDYAWACANTWGNQTSISIEMANAALAPTWAVSETTWQATARLAGWLFANVIKAAPSSANLVFHKHWYATDCAGPYMDTVYPQLLAATQAAYEHFKGAPPVSRGSSRALEIDGYLGALTLNRWAAVMGTHTGKVALVKAVQAFLNAKGARDENGNVLAVDGLGIYDNRAGDTPKSHTQYALQRYLGTHLDGFLSSPSTCIRTLQARLNSVATTGSKEF